MKPTYPLLLFAGVLVSGCESSASGSDEARPDVSAKKKVSGSAARRVEVAKLSPSRPRLDLLLPGEVEGSRDAKLAAALGGYVERVMVKDGDPVRAGQSLAWVNKSQMDVALLQAEAQLDLARTELELTQKAGKSVARVRRDAAKFRHKAAEAAYKLAEIQAQRASIRAPFSGIAAQVAVEQGEVLPPGGTVARLVQLDPINVTISVSDRDMVSLSKGMAVQVATDAQSELFDGKVARLSPAADLRTRTFVVEIELPNKERKLLPGMIATVRASMEVEGEALSIPQYVLVTKRDGTGVFVVADQEGKSVARWRPTKLGRVIRDQVIVEEGIAANDRLVVTGQRELMDGDTVIIAREGMCCKNGQAYFNSEEE